MTKARDTLVKHLLTLRRQLKYKIAQTFKNPDQYNAGMLKLAELDTQIKALDIVIPPDPAPLLREAEGYGRASPRQRRAARPSMQERVRLSVVK